MAGKRYASNKNAFGFCAICQFRYPLKQLKTQMVKLRVNPLLVCPDCWSPDHPQLLVGMWPVSDPQALRRPAPMIDIPQSRGLFAFNPVATQKVICASLPVTVHYTEVL